MIEFLTEILGQCPKISVKNLIINPFISYRWKDPESTSHSIGLYKVWTIKAELLRIVTELDPWHTEFFIYWDIGAFRYLDLHDLISRGVSNYRKWPSKAAVNRLPRDRVMFLEVVPFSTEELAGSVRYFGQDHIIDRLGGTVFGGTALAVRRYHKLYYDMVQKRINSIFAKS